MERPSKKFLRYNSAISSQELANADPRNCYTGSGAGGIIARAKPDEEYDESASMSSGNTVEQEIKSGQGRLIKSYAKIGDYYYWYSAPRFNCLGPKGLPADIQIKVEDAYRSMVENLETIPAQ
jgi:hypothetical protein